MAFCRCHGYRFEPSPNLAMDGSTDSARYFRSTSVEVWRESRFFAAVRELPIQDWLLLGYCSALVLLVLTGERNAGQGPALVQTMGLLIAFSTVTFLVRSAWLADNFRYGTVIESVLYRLTPLCTLEASYFQFRTTLPQMSSRSLDHQLYELDLRLFGVEPALWAQKWVTPALTEWFSFAYLAYFLLAALFIFPMLFVVRSRALMAEFCFGLICIFAFGHLTYTIVPGYGPYHALASEFTVPLPAGFWHDLQNHVVASAGAQKDIFPSIHTAVPTFLAYFSYRHRNQAPYKYVWPVVTFFAVNIALATMYLRWHYLIDVIAGLGYAASGIVASIIIPRWEIARRESMGLRPIWPSYRPDGTF
ncbi:MAG: hypothetical protein B6A08_12140 [Sorangiineae bacterium NIC37A_2]|nr:MAG: hypothetical protein B6A08_12140 [Sorangiineae bacterium NIC37A_2]